MGRVFHPLLFLLARCTKNQLIRQIEFLKAENQILRRRVPGKFVRVKPAEKARLMKLAEGLRPVLRQLITARPSGLWSLCDSPRGWRNRRGTGTATALRTPTAISRTTAWPVTSTCAIANRRRRREQGFVPGWRGSHVTSS
jgi:hypothetical protein